MTNVIIETADVYFFHNVLSYIIAQGVAIGYNMSEQVYFVTTGRGAVAHRSEQAAHNHLVDSSTLSSPTSGYKINEVDSSTLPGPTKTVAAMRLFLLFSVRIKSIYATADARCYIIVNRNSSVSTASSRFIETTFFTKFNHLSRFARMSK
ncbi:MAG: hypothetical protein JWN26_261 [Candidatus Saccharibacteria bacterium]|nr:hypothetical protein [Candidatus Saccharibacteria bacterium]